MSHRQFFLQIFVKVKHQQLSAMKISNWNGWIRNCTFKVKIQNVQRRAQQSNYRLKFSYFTQFCSKKEDSPKHKENTKLDTYKVAFIIYYTIKFTEAIYILWHWEQMAGSLKRDIFQCVKRCTKSWQILWLWKGDIFQTSSCNLTADSNMAHNTIYSKITLDCCNC